MNKLWGQLLMVGIPGQEPDETTRAIIQDLQVGASFSLNAILPIPSRWRL